MKQVPAGILVAGHICLDLIPTFEHSCNKIDEILAPGSLIKVGPAVTATGGAVSNTGIALHLLGVNARLAGKVGADLFGYAILDKLRSLSSSLVDSMNMQDGESSSYSIVMNPPGIDRIFFHCPGTNDTFRSEDVQDEQFFGVSLLHFGYPPLMKRMYSDGGKDLKALFLRAKSKGLTTSLDMAKPDPNSEAGQVDWRSWLKEVLPAVDLFLPSLEEIWYMMDRETFDKAQVNSDWESQVDEDLLSKLADQLLQFGASIVALKLGSQGLYLRTTDDTQKLHFIDEYSGNPEFWSGRELLVPCFQVSVAGTTGAGDSTIAGFLTGLINGESPERVLTVAVAVGACSVEQADATSGIPSWEEVQTRIESGWERQPTKILLPGWAWDHRLQVWFGPRDRMSDKS